MLVRLNSELRDVAELATSPLKFSTPIGPVVIVDTTVVGEIRSIAQIVISFGSEWAWGATLTQVLPDATVPYPLIVGNVSIEKGAQFNLTVPTVQQIGFVHCQSTIITPNNPKGQPFSAAVAHWPLSSVQVSAARQPESLPPAGMGKMRADSGIAPVRSYASVDEMEEEVEAVIDVQTTEDPAGAFEFIYVLGPNLTVVGTIRGNRRDIVVIQIRNGGFPVYSLSLTADSPVERMPYDIMVDDVLIMAEGASLRLTPPTAEQSGSLRMDAVINSGKGKQRFIGDVARWSLTSDIE